jgi:hypothetical protein
MAKSKSKSKNKKLAKRIVYTLGCGCGLFFLSMLAGGGFAGYWFYWKDLPPSRPNTPAGELARVLDKNEPDWTLDALVAKWRGKPIDKNGADVVREVNGLFPKDWSNEIQPLLETGMARNPGLSARLRPTLDQHRAAVSKARQFANLPDGRFNVEIKTNPLATPVPHLTDVRKTAILLKAMALRDAIDDNPNDAILSVQGIVQLSRYPKEEPFAISHLVHCAVVSIAALTLEDVFRHQGTKEPSEKTLADLQTLLLDEGSESRLSHTLRCERATMYQVLDRLRTKKLTLSDIAKDGNLPPPEGMDQEAHKQADSGQRVLLFRMNQAIEIAQMPSHEQYGRYMTWDNDVRREMGDIKVSDKKEGVLGALLLPAVLKIHDVEMRRCAKLRTTATGIAVERYRRANKSWPKDLASLVPKFLPSVPIDPYNGKPLTWKTYGEGVAIISWGVRGIGPADFANWNEHDHGSVAFRLWHRHLRKAPT